jgi:hypothetical protein
MLRVQHSANFSVNSYIGGTAIDPKPRKAKTVGPPIYKHCRRVLETVHEKERMRVTFAYRSAGKSNERDVQKPANIDDRLH